MQYLVSRKQVLNQLSNIDHAFQGYQVQSSLNGRGSLDESIHTSSCRTTHKGEKGASMIEHTNAHVFYHKKEEKDCA